jgi:hypothetical protein
MGVNTTTTTVMGTLADLLQDGVRLDYTDPDRPEFRVLPKDRARVAALLTAGQRAATHRALRTIATYRKTLLTIFTLTATNQADPAAACDAIQSEMALHDDLGVRLASLIRATAIADYTAQTKRCAYCGHPDHADGDR